MRSRRIRFAFLFKTVSAEAHPSGEHSVTAKAKDVTSVVLLLRRPGTGPGAGSVISLGTLLRTGRGVAGRSRGENRGLWGDSGSSSCFLSEA